MYTPSFCSAVSKRKPRRSGNIAYRVYFNGNTATVVPDANLTGLPVHRDADFTHVCVVLFIVGSVDQNLIEYFVQTRDVGDFAVLHHLCLRVENPHLLFGPFNRSNVRIGTLENVFKGSKLAQTVRTKLLLIGFMDGHPTFWYLLLEDFFTSF